MFKGQSFPMKHYFISGLGYRRIIYPTARFVRMEERDGESILKQGLWGWRRGTENLYSCKVCKDGGKGRRIYPQVRFVRVEERDGESILKQGLWGWRRGKYLSPRKDGCRDEWRENKFIFFLKCHIYHHLKSHYQRLNFIV